MKKIAKSLVFPAISLVIFLMLIMPVLSLAQGGNSSDSRLVPCGTEANPTPCDFNQLMALINKIIRFVLFDLALPIAAIMFAYAGFLMVIGGGEAAGVRTKAKTIFTNTLLGLVFAVAAWLIINTILSILGYNGTWIGFVFPTS